MNLVDALGSLALSLRSRLLVLCLLGLLFFANMAMLLLAAMDPQRFPNWIEAAVGLLAILLPILLISIVMLASEGGEEAARIKTFNFMTRTLPRSMRMIRADMPVFQAAEKVRRIPLAPRVRVEVAQQAGSCIGHYRVWDEDRLLLAFTLEVNIRKANLVVCLPKSRLASPQAAGAEPTWLDAVRRAFPHSIVGAAKAGYVVNDVVHVQPDHVELVFIIALDDRFMLSPYERVYVAQDMTFFLASLIKELDPAGSAA